MALTASTTGITKIARPSAVAYSARSIVANSNREARKGTSITSVVRISDNIIAPKRKRLWLPRVNIEARCERILYEWKISAIDIVKNAIVMPCISAVPQFGSKSTVLPRKYATSVRTDTRKP